MLNHAQPRFQNAVGFEAFKDACSGLPAKWFDQVARMSNRTTAATRNNLCLSGCCPYPVADFNYVFLHLPSFSIIFHHFSSFSIIFHSFSSFSIIFHHFPSFSIIFHHFPPNNSDDPTSAMDGLKPPFSTRAETSTVPLSQGLGRSGGGPQGSRRCHLGDPIFFGEKHL